MIRRLPGSLVLLLLIFPLSSAKFSTQNSKQHAHTKYAEKLHLPWLHNIGKVNEYLYRGSQPNEKALRELKKLGITTIVDLRGERQGTVRSERKKAEALGIRVVNIRASGWSPPKDQQIVEFLTLTLKRPREKIYVHCWLGDDRTGVFLATYRIAFDHWTAEKAIDKCIISVQRILASDNERVHTEFPRAFRDSPSVC